MIYDTLTKTGLPVRYSHFTAPQAPPFLVWLGNGQNQMSADNTRHWHLNTYSVEYYFRDKSPELENTIEEALLEDGYRFDKSEDVYIDSEGVYSITYSVE